MVLQKIIVNKLDSIVIHFYFFNVLYSWYVLFFQIRDCSLFELDDDFKGVFGRRYWEKLFFLVELAFCSKLLEEDFLMNKLEVFFEI